MTEEKASTPNRTIRGEKVRFFVGLGTILVWVVLGAIWFFNLERDTFARTTGAIAAVVAVGLISWAWRFAKTPNDFLTVTTTARLMLVPFCMVTAYSMAQQFSGVGGPAIPEPVSEYVVSLLGQLLGVSGIVLLLLTDFVRAFTIPTMDKRQRLPRKAGNHTPVVPSTAPDGRIHDNSVRAKTFGASGADIHRMFRAGSGEGPMPFNGVANEDAARADIVGDYLAMLSTMLHGHHEGEDTLLWGRLESRAPSCSAHVDRMKAQHSEILMHLDKLDASLPTWRASGRKEDAASVLNALTGINAALAVHVPDEGRTSCP